jgi:phage-related protein
MSGLREVEWVGSSLQDLQKFPIRVKREMGFALHRIQEGKKPAETKPLKGLGSGILEIVSDFDKGTYRTIYAVKLGTKIYVLHAFQKKSTIGIKTPKHEIELIKSRLLEAKRLAANEN